MSAKWKESHLAKSCSNNPQK